VQSIEWLVGSTPVPTKTGMVGEISGTYTAAVQGTQCVLKLWFNGQGFVSGSFSAEGETLEVRGSISPSRTVNGFLLEPFGHLPLAMFIAQTTVKGLSLRVGAPEFETQGSWWSEERLEFSRVADLEPLELCGGLR
jgi:hypothetical protein